MTLDLLLAEREIRTAMMVYCRGIDRRDEALLRSVYHDDAIDDHGLSGVASGADFCARVDPAHPRSFPREWSMTQHFLGNHLAQIDGDRATSETYFIARHRYATDTGGDEDLLIAGRYLDHWERRQGPFKIAHRRLVYDWTRTDPVTARWPGPDHDVPKAFASAPAITGGSQVSGQASPADASYELFGVADVGTRLFAAIPAGDVAVVRACYAEDAVLINHSSGERLGPDEIARKVESIAQLPEFGYHEIRRQPTTSGFVQQHVVRGVSAAGDAFEIRACCVATVTSGRIARLEEYTA
jgi:ketosteroid isomerase-like protein